MKRNILAGLCAALFTIQAMNAEECCESTSYDCCGRGSYLPGRLVELEKLADQNGICRFGRSNLVGDVVEVESTVLRPKFQSANGTDCLQGMKPVTKTGSSKRSIPIFLLPPLFLIRKTRHSLTIPSPSFNTNFPCFLHCWLPF